MRLLTRHSPNFDARPLGTKITTIVMHHTNMESAHAALEHMCNPASKVSCHYLISITGKIFQLVPDLYRAWHAGLSSWRGQEKVNDYSIGIELDNCGNAHFPEVQINALLQLCKKLLSDHPHIEARNIVSHAEIAPDRKDDPNHFFPWQQLAQHGIGLFPNYDANDQTILWQRGDYHPEIKTIQQQLTDYGCKLDVHGTYDERMEQVVIAFNRRFNPLSFNMSTHNAWSTASAAALSPWLDNVKN